MSIICAGIVTTRIIRRPKDEEKAWHDRDPIIVLRDKLTAEKLCSQEELNAIKELLGHTNLSATQIYTHNSIERLKKIYQQAHPKA